MQIYNIGTETLGYLLQLGEKNPQLTHPGVPSFNHLCGKLHSVNTHWPPKREPSVLIGSSASQLVPASLQALWLNLVAFTVN